MQNIILLIKEISNFHGSQYRNVNTYPLRTGRGSLKIHAAHFGKPVV